MNNPIQTMLAWLQSQDSDIQKDIALVMSSLHSGFKNTPYAWDTENLLEGFYKRLSSCADAELGSVGFLISFRAIFDYSIAHKRGLLEGWVETRQIFESVVQNEQVHDDSKLKDSARKILTKLSSRQEQWINVCRQWTELKASALSDDAIDNWEREVFMASISDVFADALA